MKKSQKIPSKITCLKDLRNYKKRVAKRAHLARELFKSEGIQMIEHITSASTTKLIAATPALIQGVMQSQSQQRSLASHEAQTAQIGQKEMNKHTYESKFQSAVEQKGTQFVSALLEELAVRYIH